MLLPKNDAHKPPLFSHLQRLPSNHRKKKQTLCTGLSISDFRHHTCNPFTPHKLSAGVRRDWITHLPQQASCTHRRASVSCPSVWKLFSPHTPWRACPPSWERPAVRPRQCSPPSVFSTTHFSLLAGHPAASMYVQCLRPPFRWWGRTWPDLFPAAPPVPAHGQHAGHAE